MKALTLFVFLSSIAYGQVAFKFAWTPRTVLADCSGIVTEYQPGSLAIFLNGVSQTVTPDPEHHAGFLSSIGPIKLNDVVYAVLTLPDGKTVRYDDILGPSNNPNITREVSAFLGTYVNAPGLTLADGTPVPEVTCSMRKDAYYQ